VTTRAQVRPRFLLGVAVVATSAVGLAACTAAEAGSAAGSTVSPTPTGAATAPVVRGDLVDRRTVPGALGYGDPVPLASAGTGTVTALPAPGDVVGRDGALYAVDEVPVRALHGTVPLWRTLEQGQRGADVDQLKDNLRALGYDVADDDRFDRRTREAVRSWQRDRGRERTGTLGASDIAFVPGDLRVAEVTGRLGDAAGDAVWGYTSTTLVATASVSAAELARFPVGAPVEVGLADGTRLPGTVRSTGGPTGGAGTGPGSGSGSGGGGGGGGGGSGDDVTVVVGLDAPLPDGASPAGAVDLAVDGARRDGVLSVPVTALLAGADGYVVEERAADGTTTRVPVEVGFFAGGRVEVSGDGLEDGDEVVVPS